MDDVYYLGPEQIEIDVSILQEMIAHLDDYLERDRTFMPIKVETPMDTRWPTISIGAVLSRLARVRAFADRLSDEQRQIVREVEEALDRVRRWYPERFREHALRELSSLTDSWRWFLDDCYEKEQGCAEAYPTEARTRTTMQLIIDYLGEDQVPWELIGKIEAQDHRLRMRFREGDFIWPQELASQFPRERYWWLYGKPA